VEEDGMTGEYIIIEGTKIKEHLCGPVPDGAVKVPDGWQGVVGMDVGEFDADWQVLPLTERINRGFVKTPSGYKLVDDQFVPMSLEERVTAGIVVLSGTEVLEGSGDAAYIREKVDIEKMRDGLMPVPKGMKLVTGSDYRFGADLESMTLEEQLAAGQITQATADTLQALNIRAERDSYYKAGDDAILGLNRQLRAAEKAGEDTSTITAKITAWDAYNQALADVPEQGGFPWKVEWPVRPDGVVA